MRLESALFSSRSGIDVHGRAIAVVGDNIANVSTTGYKASRSEFGDIYAEGGLGRQSTAGPVSGNGVSLKEVVQIHEVGTAEVTGRSLDAAIDGTGFFLVGDAAAPEYSRAGAFEMNGAGELVNADGKTVLGFGTDGTTLGTLNLLLVKTTGTVTSKVGLAGNLQSDTAVTTAPTAPATFTALTAAASSTMTTTVYDSLGASHSIAVAYFRTANNTWTAQAYIDGGDVGGTKGQPVQIGGNATLAFDTNGVLTDASKAAAQITATPAYGGGAAAGNFVVDLSNFSQYAAPSELLSVTQDGQGSGQIKDYQIRRNGEIYAQLDTGSGALVCTNALATFPNQNGLQRSGSGTYSETPETGTKVIGKPGVGGSGEISGAALERSTVDISGQFVDLILLQRGYQANSQALSATNDLMRETIQLIR